MPRHAQIPTHAHFVADTEVELIGANGAPSFMVEVEFEASRESRDPYTGVATGGGREIKSVRPFRWKYDSFGVMHTTRIFLPCPEWLADILKDAIDVDALFCDWESL